MRFFFYGTLMDPGLLAAVIGRRVKPSGLKPAVVKGYRRLAVRGLDYPIVVADKNASVKGVMLERVTGAAHKRLMAYETDYRLAQIPVQVRGRVHARALIFVGEPEAFTVSGKFWSLAGWQKRYKAAALAWIFKQRWIRI